LTIFSENEAVLVVSARYAGDYFFMNLNLAHWILLTWTNMF